MQKQLLSLRNKIDDIDDKIISLLKERSEIIHKVAILKGKEAIKIRPAREIQMNQKFATIENIDAYPAPVLQRIWREIIIATLTLEGGFSVGILADAFGDEVKNWALHDLCRDHFGTWAPIVYQKDIQDLLQDLLDIKVDIAILPQIEATFNEPWWHILANMNQDNNKLKINVCFYMPFTGLSNATLYNDIKAYALSCAKREESGFDETVFVANFVDDIHTYEINELCKNNKNYKVSSIYMNKNKFVKAVLMHKNGYELNENNIKTELNYFSNILTIKDVTIIGGCNQNIGDRT